MSASNRMGNNAAAGSQTAMLRLIRAVGFFTALINPVLKLALPEESHDPWVLRGIFSFIYLFNAVMTFFVPWYARNIRPIVYITMYLTTAWLLWLLFVNGFRYEYVIHLFISLFLQFTLFYRVRDLLFYGCYTMVLSAVAGLLVDHFEVQPLVFYVLEGFLFITGILPMFYRIKLDESLEAGQKMQRLISEVVMKTSPDGIFVVDNEGRPLGGNKQLKLMWGFSDQLFKPTAVIEALRHVSAQVKDAVRWEEVWQKGNSAHPMPVKESVTLLDGRTFEVSTQPLKQQGTKIGMVWYFKDITELVQREAHQLEERKRLEKNNQLLQKLASSASLKEGNLDVYFGEITRAVADNLGLDRVSVWTLTREKDILTLRNQFNTGEGNFMKGHVLNRKDHEAYFASLLSGELLNIPNTLEDGRIPSYISEHAPTNRPRSILDAPLRLQGEIVGTISADKSGGNRIWTETEQDFLLSVADLLSLSLEVSRRVHAEEDLARSLALLKAVFDAMGSGILVTDLNRNVLDYNKEYLSIWSLTPEQMKLPADDVIAMSNKQLRNSTEAMSSFQAMLSRPDFEGKELLEFLDGRVVERFTQSLMLTNITVGRIWYYRDITQRILTDRALSESERKNKAMLDALPDIMIRMDAKGTILDFRDPSSEEPWFSDPAGPGADIRVQLHSGFGEKCVEEATKVIESGNISVFEASLGNDENSRILETRIVRSGPAEVLLILRDITQRKKSEAELVQRNFELDSFVYRASHDLKAPLNSVMGLIQIAKNEPDKDKVIDYLGMMDKSVVKLDTFIRNLNEFSRITRLELKYVEVDFVKLVNEVLEGLRFLENFQRPSITTSFEGTVTFFSDPFHLEIILSNLISNAIKYQDLRKEKPWIKISVMWNEEAASVSVADNGVGIADAHQDKIFSLFFRATNQSFGSGIGLYITDNAIRKVNGVIQLQSKEGEGSTFILTLPNMS